MSDKAKEQTKMPPEQPRVAPPNGAQATPARDATRVRKPRSTPLQTMARIEDAMNDLTDEQRKIVCQWFGSTYMPTAKEGDKIG